MLLVLANFIAIFSAGMMLWQLRKFRQALKRREEENENLLKEYALVVNALEFYRHVEQHTQNPLFTGDVATKALKGKLH